MALRQLNHMRRFYKHARIGQLPDGEFNVLLDGKSLKTPSGRLLSTPSFQVAHVVQNEFNAQPDYLISPTMPMVPLT